MKTSARTHLVEERKLRGWSQQQLADHLGTTQHNVSRWERGQTIPGSYFRTKLCNLFGKSAQELGLLDIHPSSSEAEEVLRAAPPSVSSVVSLALWVIPYLRNPHFTGRESLLVQLEGRFSATKRDEPRHPRCIALTQSQAITGLGGIGKTQIAVEYAYRAREEGRYVHTLWINAASEGALMSSFVALAEIMPVIVSSKEADQHKLATTIIRWLERCEERWLLIFDNADDVALLQPYLPLQGNGSILFTTRAHAVSAFAASIDVEQMGLQEGTMLLLHRTQRQNAADEEHNEATNIVIALDGFPLALDQAGAYIEETGCQFRDYLQVYQQHRQTLLARRGTQFTNYPSSVATTWSLSFEYLEQSSPAAAELLRLCAFLAPDAIPEELISQGQRGLGPRFQPITSDLHTLNEAIGELQKFSLIQRNPENKLLRVHRLVQAVIQDNLEKKDREQWAERAVRMISSVFPETVEMATWPSCLRLLPQAQVCSQLIRDASLLFPEAASLLFRTARYLKDRALYEQAEHLLRQSIHLWEQCKEPVPTSLATALNTLAELYRELGKYGKAEPLYQQALRIGEHHEGTEYPLVAISLNGLAALYHHQGKYTDAEPLYRRSLRLREHHGGVEHPQMASPLNNLANLYRDQGKYAEAEALYQRALHIREQHLGFEHLQITAPLNNLALVYWHQGKYAEAEVLYRRSLSIREQHLGPEHPQVAYPLNNLAELYRELGKYGEAEPLYQRALRLWMQHLGAEHPQVAYPLDGLAALYCKLGKYAEAEPLYQQALHIREQHLGLEHPLMAASFNSMANLYRDQGQYAKAEPFYLQAVSILEHTMGHDHPDVAASLNSLANMYTMQEKYAEAEICYRRALFIREQALGEYHLETAETLHDFAIFQENQEEEEALSLYQRALVIREQILGEMHLVTRATRNRYLAFCRVSLQAEEEKQEGAAPQGEY